MDERAPSSVHDALDATSMYTAELAAVTVVVSGQALQRSEMRDGDLRPAVDVPSLAVDSANLVLDRRQERRG